MSEIKEMIKFVNGNVNETILKKNYSEPRIYTGKENVNQWHKLSKERKEAAINKEWFVYFSFRNPETGLLERQNHIKGKCNKHKNKDARMKILESLRDKIKKALDSGYVPEKYKLSFIKDNNSEDLSDIQKAFKYVLEIKKKEVKETTYKDYENRLSVFSGYLKKQGVFTIKQIDKTIVSKFLSGYNDKNSNNFRAALSSIFSVLSEHGVVEVNIIKELGKKKERDKAITVYSDEMVEEIEELLKEQNKDLLMYINLFSIMFWRPIEAVRIDIKDIDLVNKRMRTNTKGKDGKTKIIPSILHDELKEYIGERKEGKLFQLNPISDVDKRNNMTRQFRLFREANKIDPEFKMIYFRHTKITKLFNKLRETMTITETIEVLTLITGHISSAIWKYIKRNDLELPEDYSNLL